MLSFTEFYRLSWFARNIAEGPFSYFWYDQRRTVRYPVDMHVSDYLADDWIQ